MAELSAELLVLLPITSDQRRDAALTLAQMCPDKHRLAYFLVQLGLAVHQDDGTFTGSAEVVGAPVWFHRRTGGGSYQLPMGGLDDCR